MKILLRQFNITTVYVTHDHYEALILADLLVIMDRGSIEQAGTYEEIYNRPKNVFVAGFLNRHIGTVPINLIDVRYMAQGQRLGNVRIGVRSEDVDVSRTGREHSIKGIIKGKVSLPMLNTTILSIHVGEHEVHAQTSVDGNLLTGDQVWLTFKRYHAFDNASGLRLRSYPETP